jgi:hypothetical protein
LRFGANRLLVALHRISATLEQSAEPDIAAWAALVALTAGEGLGFNRAFLLLADGDQLVGWLGVGPRDRAEAAVLWGELRRRCIDPFERLAAIDPAVIEAERARHADVLQRLGIAARDVCSTAHKAFIGRLKHPNPCVRHWVHVLESESLAVFPLLEPGRLGGVVLADNFVTRATISPARLEAGATIVHALHGALERSRLLRRLQDEHRRRLAAEHTTAMLEAARTLAHDVKNPLAVAGGVARELLAAPEVSRDVLPRQLGVIASAIGRAEHRLATLAEELASRGETISPALPTSAGGRAGRRRVPPACRDRTRRGGGQPAAGPTWRSPTRRCSSAASRTCWATACRRCARDRRRTRGACGGATERHARRRRGG